MNKKLSVILKGIFAVLCIAGVVASAVLTSGKDVYATWWGLMPPVLAILLALVTKEVYSSLFAGIVYGALLYSNFSFSRTFN